MSQDSSWTYEEMSRTMQAERLADAARYRLAASVVGTSESPRMKLARALRSLATLLDGEVSVQAQPDRRLARAV